jgi:NADPH:quinone reductase-like Zn-dependent oxidoreductase
VKAIRYERYGPPDVLELADIDVPAVGDDEVLVRVRAAPVNPLDWQLIDIAGNRTLSETRRVLVPKGVLVAVGGPNEGRWIGPLGRSVRMALLSPAVSQRMVFFLAHENKDDLVMLRELLEAGKVTPVIDRTYPLSEAAEAIRYLEQGHAKGKVVVTM